MPYTIDDWRKRLAERSDLTTRLAHLTRSNSEMDSIGVLLKILRERKLVGSTTESGFIVGSRPAVCLQDAPLYAVSQNLHFEAKMQESKDNAKTRYSPNGLSFAKEYVFRKGGRPVVYGPTSELKECLREAEWWRIVNLDLSSKDAVIDWTHEREWRVPDELGFELSNVVVLVNGTKGYREFVRRANDEDAALLTQIAGIVCLPAVFF